MIGPPTRLRLLRMKLGLSQNALAQKVGIQPNAVSQCERGLESKALLTLAQFFGETPHKLLEYPTETVVQESSEE